MRKLLTIGFLVLFSCGEAVLEEPVKECISECPVVERKYGDDFLMSCDAPVPIPYGSLPVSCQDNETGSEYMCMKLK